MYRCCSCRFIAVGKGKRTPKLDSVYHVLTLTSVGDSVDCVVLLLALVISSPTLIWQLLSASSSSVVVVAALSWCVLLMALGLLSVDLQRFEAVDNCMRRIWLALWPTLLRILLPANVPLDVAVDVLWWAWWEFILTSSYNFLAFGMEWLVSWSCDGATWEFPFTPYSHGQKDESKTSIEFFMAWSHRQQSRNSSIVTTPSLLRSIFCAFHSVPTNWFFSLSSLLTWKERTIKCNKLFCTHNMAWMHNFFADSPYVLWLCSNSIWCHWHMQFSILCGNFSFNKTNNCGEIFNEKFKKV